MQFLKNLKGKLLHENTLKSLSILNKARMTNDNNNIQKLMKIGTHDGTFHCDESLACFLLQQLSIYKNCKIIRTRNAEELKDCDVVVDVGGIYDPSVNRFDHHQKSFDKTLKDILPGKSSELGSIKLSSAGLIYAHFGHEILANILKCEKSDKQIDIIFDMIYENFVKEIDAIDNGISMCGEQKPLYNINTDLSHRVSYLRPNWNETETPEILYDCFMKAIDLVGNEFIERVNYYGHSWYPARKSVSEAFENRFDYDPSGQIIVLNHYLPWIQHLFQIEKENNCEGQILFAIFPQSANDWRLRAVPINESSFQLRNPINEEWRGQPSDEICRLSKIDGCIFVHSTGFIGGNRTLEGALEMARQSLKCKKIKQ